MSKATRRLGRGLDSLVSNLTSTEKAPTERAEATEIGPPDEVSGPAEVADGGVRTISVEALRPNRLQPRSAISDQSVDSLARSIERDGMLQPITVRRDCDVYEIIAGERRWRAAKSLGLRRVPVIARPATDEQMLELALIENLQREDLNAIDRARAYSDFCERFSLRPEEVGERLGEDRTTVVNYLRLLDLPDAIQERVAAGELSMGHARCLAGITDNDKRMTLAEAVVENELSVRALEAIVRRERGKREPRDGEQSVREVARSNHLRDLERRFEQRIKTKVLIREGKRKGSGRIVIEFYSLDDFDRISALLGVSPE